MSLRALVIGEALIDEYPDHRMVAGAPFHVAAHLADLGWEAHLVTRVGNDADGRLITEETARLGVATDLIEIDPTLPTGITRLTFHGSDHSFDVVRPAAWDALAGPDPAPAHDLITFGTLVLRDERSRSAVSRLVEASPGMIAVDVNIRPPHVTDEAIRFAVTSSHLLKVNEQELHRVAAALDVAPDPLELGRPWVCITRGSRGAVLFRSDGRQWNTPGLVTQFVDAVGAGDALFAALVDGLVRRLDPGKALDRANRRAAATVAQRGGLP